MGCKKTKCKQQGKQADQKWAEKVGRHLWMFSKMGRKNRTSFMNVPLEIEDFLKWTQVQ